MNRTDKQVERRMSIFQLLEKNFKQAVILSYNKLSRRLSNLDEKQESLEEFIRTCPLIQPYANKNKRKVGVSARSELDAVIVQEAVDIVKRNAKKKKSLFERVKYNQCFPRKT